MVEISLSKNGPIRVRGEVVLKDAEGNVIELQKDVFSLCRCGQSQNKPFCDGTHKTCGFVG